MNILRVPEPSMRLFEKTAEEARYFIITKPHPEWVGEKARIEVLRHYPRKVITKNFSHIIICKCHQFI